MTITRKCVILLILAIVLMIVPVSASLRISGTVKYMNDVTPGETVSFPVTVSIGSSDPAADYDVTVFGFGNNPQGNYVTLLSDTGSQNARLYLTLDKSTLHIKPGKSETVTATITVPQGVNGGLYALINIHPAQVTTGGAGAGVSTAINIPVMVTIKGTTLTETGTVGRITIDDSKDPILVTTEFTNTGNHHYYGASNTIEISNSNGMIIGQFTSSPLVTAIVPGGTVEFTQPVKLALVPDTYTVRSYVQHSNNSTIDTNTNQFTVTNDKTGGIPVTILTKPVGETPILFAGIVLAICIGAIALLLISRRRKD